MWHIAKSIPLKAFCCYQTVFSCRNVTCVLKCISTTAIVTSMFNNIIQSRPWILLIVRIIVMAIAFVIFYSNVRTCSTERAWLKPIGISIVRPMLSICCLVFFAKLVQIFFHTVPLYKSQLVTTLILLECSYGQKAHFSQFQLL